MSLRILLVDDNLTFMTAVSQCLALLPNTEVVGQVTSGAEALIQVKALHPDLVLLDIVMPHMTGLEVAAQLRTWPHAPHILFYLCMTTIHTALRHVNSVLCPWWAKPILSLT